MKTLDREEILEFIRNQMVSLFEIPAEQITPEARLYEDLDLDSIDAVDLVVQVQKYTNQRVSPDEFKSVMTIGDVVAAVERLLAK